GTGVEGTPGDRQASVAPIREMSSLNGSSTGAFGKWHLTPLWETSMSGPYTTWPTSSGFEKFYGFLGGETNQWSPLLYDGVTKVELPKDPRYHFMTDMTNQAIAWARFQHAMTPDKPFFMYFAPGATHAPHHVPKAWADKYKGKFDDGWDALRERTIKRQKELGVIPHGAQLTARPKEIPTWDAMPEELKPVLRRQ